MSKVENFIFLLIAAIIVGSAVGMFVYSMYVMGSINIPAIIGG